MSFFGELSRRNVFRVAIAYSIVAWLIAQVTELALDSFGTPDWVIKTLLVLLVIGLPIAVIFAWAFELTPEGVKREKDVDRTESITSDTGRKINFIIIGVLVIALGIAVSTHQWTAGTPEGSTAATAEDSDQSIAVLPFVNMSDDADNEYFSDGISEELLNVLVRIDGLRVASRTSSFAFKGKDTSIPNIAESLGVAHILEGSVRKAGNTVRVTAQLIDARTDTHLWSETYDRKLEDIFAIQDEISSHIVAALKVALGTGSSGAIDLVQQPTDNLDAYQNYLRGRYLWQRRGEDNIRNAIEAFEKAIELDPKFARAWSSLAAAHTTLPTYSDASPEVHYALATFNAHKALSLDDTIAEAYAVLAEEARGKMRWSEAEKLYKKAIASEPKNSTSYLWYGEHLLCVGRTKAALEIGLIAYRLDPLHPGTNQVLGEMYEAVADIESMEKSSNAAFKLGHNGGLFAIAQQRINEKDFTEASRIMNLLAAEFDLPAEMVALRIAAFQSSDQVAAYLDLLENKGDKNTQIRFLWDYIRLGQLDVAFNIVSDPNVFISNTWFDLWRSDTSAFRADPRFEALVRSAGFVEYWNEYGWPPACKQTDGKIVCQ